MQDIEELQESKKTKTPYHYRATNPKTIQTSLRFSQSEYDRLISLCENANMNKANFVRYCIFSKSILIVPGMLEIAEQVRLTGNNLNQIAHALNQQNFSNASKNLMDVQKQLLNIRLQLLDIEKRCAR